MKKIDSKRLDIYRLPEESETEKGWQELLNKLPYTAIDCCNWKKEYPYCPDVCFTAGWNYSGFFLNYLVSEQQLRAVNERCNSPVWEDSCVEFFFQFGAGDRHYSFEFNPLGSFLGQINHVVSSEWLPEEKLNQVRITGTHVGKTAPLVIEGNNEWRLSIFLPFSLLTDAEQNQIKPGMEFRANFFKCGDKCRMPHFLSWSPINWPQPSFHRPQFFGVARLF